MSRWVQKTQGGRWMARYRAADGKDTVEDLGP